MPRRKITPEQKVRRSEYMRRYRADPVNKARQCLASQKYQRRMRLDPEFRIREKVLKYLAAERRAQLEQN